MMYVPTNIVPLQKRGKMLGMGIYEVSYMGEIKDTASGFWLDSLEL